MSVIISLKSKDELGKDVIINNPNLDIESANFYAKKSCNKCNGKGYLNFTRLDTSELTILCACAHKNIKHHKIVL